MPKDWDLLDILQAENVEVKIRHDGKVLWVNVDGRCALRVYMETPNLVIEDDYMLGGVVQMFDGKPGVKINEH